MNNQIESTNAQLRAMIRDHRGLSLTRRIKAIFWWCYMHSPNPLPPAQILTTMPTDTDIEAAYHNIATQQQKSATLTGWGDAITWNEFHHTSPYRTDWD